jgi:hypothetical protein
LGSNFLLRVVAIGVLFLAPYVHAGCTGVFVQPICVIRHIQSIQTTR